MSKVRSGSTIHSLVCPRTDLEALFTAWYVQGQIWKHFMAWYVQGQIWKHYSQLGMSKDRSGRYHSQLGMSNDRSESTIHSLVCPRTDLEALFIAWYVQGQIWSTPFIAWYVQGQIRKHHSQLGMSKVRSGSTIHSLVCQRTDLEALFTYCYQLTHYLYISKSYRSHIILQ